MNSKLSAPETLRDIKRMIVRHRWRFIIPAVAVAFAVMLGALLLPRKYEAVALFERRNDVVVAELADNLTPTASGVVKRSLVEELRGIPAINQVIDRLELVPDAEQIEDPQARKLVEVEKAQLRAHIAANTQAYFNISTPEVDRVRLVYTDQDPVRARHVVNGLIENYIENTRRQIDASLKDAASFFEQQVQIHRDKIAELEKRLVQFEVQNAGMLPDDQAAVQEVRISAEERMMTLQQKHEALLRQIDRLKDALSGTDEAQPSSVVKSANPELVRARDQLKKYQEKLDHCLTIEKMTDHHPTVMTLRRKIVELQSTVSELPAEVVTEKVFGENQKQTQIEMQLIEANALAESTADELAMVRKQVARMRGQSAQFFSVRADYRKMTREIADAERQLEFWEDRLHRINVSRKAEMGRKGITMHFIQPCGPIRIPSSPDLMQVLFAAAILGLLSGVASVILADRTDQTIHSLEQANQAMRVPVLGAVAEIISARQERLRRLGRLLVYPAVTVTAVAILGAGVYLNYVTFRKPASHVESSYIPMQQSSQAAATPEAWDTQLHTDGELSHYNFPPMNEVEAEDTTPNLSAVTD